MSDVVNLARAGIRGVGLITAKFAEEAEFTTASLGMPAAPWLQLPYPVAATGDEAMRSLAASLVRSIVRSLRGDE